MRKSRFTEAQIVAILRELDAGTSASELGRRHGVHANTISAWKAKYGGLQTSDLVHLRQLEDEGRRKDRVIARLTLPALIRILKLVTDGGEEREETLARLKVTRAAYARLKNLAREPWAGAADVEDLRKHLKTAYAHHRGRQDRTLPPQDENRSAAASRMRREFNAAQSREIVRLRDEGAINDAVMNRIQRELDLDARSAWMTYIGCPSLVEVRSRRRFSTQAERNQ